VKQIAQYQDGRMELQEVPKPTAPPGGVLVRLTHSVISPGTEKMKVEQAKMNLLQKAKARPDQVRKVLEVARNMGWKSALEKVRNRLESPSPLGYSAAGIVVAVDPANGRFKVGDRVACAGAECAFHAEYVAIPDMLAAPIPSGVPNWKGAYTTLCSIALHAVRQTEPRLGERVLVMGQGMIGLLITNFLKASGARVMAVDLIPSRRKVAEAMGAERVVILGQQNLSDEVRLWSEGYGVDAAVICTATDSNKPIEEAAEACRDRARMVDVGITKIELPWRLFSEKEIEFRFSRSYGPGRYDPNYEWGGNDYPIGFVRWTEQRNFQASLHAMLQGLINLEALTTRRVAFTDALGVYQTLTTSQNEIGIVLEYPDIPSEALEDRTQRSAPLAGAPSRTGKLSAPAAFVDVIGAGNFARTMLLPHLKEKIRFRTVVNQTSLSANHVKTKFAFEHAETSSDAVFQGDEHGAVIISTRHHLHAPLVLSALKAKREVFVEKPICLTRDELREIDRAYANGASSVQVGFNRRFAPASIELKQLLAGAPGPMSVSYRCMAGKLDPGHWYSNIAESGGRVLGETCHFLDYLRFLFDSEPVQVFAQTTWPASGKMAFPDSVCAQIEFANGSCGQLDYSAQGDPAYPKEAVTVFASGLVVEIHNFLEMHVYRGRKKTKKSFSSKGHAEQMAAWLEFLRGAAEHPFPYENSRESMLLTFAVLESIREGRAVRLSELG
jgi:predicted dehydrogenase/threonine dehydrogenase-like Zn-dependent dehydrogenase